MDPGQDRRLDTLFSRQEIEQVILALARASDRRGGGGRIARRTCV